MALVLRGTKGSELTHEELDGNFTYLDAKSAAVVGYTGTAKTLALTDINTLVDCTSGSAVTITIPPQASVEWTDDAEIHVRMSGTGQVSIAVGAGVTVPPLTAPVNLTAQGAVVTLKRRSADVWALIGQTGTVVLDTDDISEGATNKYFTEGRVRSAVLTGLSLLTGGVISAADSVLSALGKLQKQISDAVTAIGGKQDTLVSGTNLKTVNGNSLLGSGNLVVSGADNSTETVAISSGTLNLSATTKEVIVVDLNQNVTSVTMPAGVAGQAVNRRVVFTQSGAANFTVAGWTGVTIEGGVAPVAATGVGAVTEYMLSNTSNGGWRMYVDQVGGGFAKEYVSAEQTITVGGALSLTHGLGGIPKLVVGTYVCKTAEAGFSVGDVFYDSFTYGYTDAGVNVTTTLCMDATTLFLVYQNGVGNFRIRHKTTGAMVNATPANWRYVVRAWL